jgi:hypothetical protein
MTLNDLFRYEDGKIFWKIRPCIGRKAGDEAGTRYANGYIVAMYKGIRYPVHRAVWEMHNGPIPTGLVVDHINRDRSDNRIENLRLVTQQQNVWNSKGYNAIGVKHVEVRGNRYRVRVLNRRYGSYESLELADLVAQEVRHKLQGEYAYE